MTTPQTKQKLFPLIKRLFGHISTRRKYHFLLLLFLTLISSFAEIISLGAVVPFIGILTQPEVVFNSSFVTKISPQFGIVSASDLVMPLTVLFALAALVAGGLRLLLLWVGSRLGNATAADVGIEIFSRTLYQPYRIHIARNSSEIISAISQKVGAATNVLVSGVTAIMSLILFVSILMLLLFMDPFVAIVAAISFGGAYTFIAFQTKRRLSQNSERIAHEHTQVIKALQEGLGAIRDVLLDGSQSVYSGIYSRAIIKLLRANVENTFINQAPRYVMEAIGIALIACFALILSYRAGGIAAALPILGMVALGAQRLLPIMQQLYGNWSVLEGSRASLIDVLDLLEQPSTFHSSSKDVEPINFRNSISIKGLRFRYNDDGPWVLNGINLEIFKGERIGFIGSTGCGKSTLMDLLMGLLEPTSGSIVVDDKTIEGEVIPSWQKNIAHVPQNIYLADTSITENIAFGLPADQIDFELVKSSAERSKLNDLIENNQFGFHAVIGERGVRLSGGQRQRIGIARALYKQAKILVFDEATSALDSDTEKTIMNTIESLSKDLTVLIIAHRVTTLANCNKVVELSDGKINRIGTYHEVIQQ
jgi:ABC-type bacteriocin/lantibiotic exporter with double-glycine peptidase domain